MRDGPAETPARREPVAPPGSVAAKGWLMLALTTLLFGATWPLVRVGVALMPPVWFACIRIIGASALLFVFLALIGRLRMPSRQDVPAILSVGICMMGAFVVLSHIGMQWVEAGRAALLVYTVPLWVTPIAVAVLRERLSRARLLGLVVGLAGLAILFNPLGFDWTDTNVIIGNGILVVASMLWAISIIQMRMQVYRLDTLQLAPWQLLVSAMVTLPAALILEHDRTIDWSDADTMTVMVAGTLLLAVSLSIGTSAVRHLPAITASVGFLGVPVVSMLIGTFLLGEAIGPTLIGGLVVILIGVAIVSVAQVRDNQRDRL
jgi:drug/metabolite transporter (DMT)-like permease